MNIEAVTTVEGRPVRLLGISQRLRVLEIEVYRRRWARELEQSVSAVDFGRRFFSTNYGTSVRWDGHHLTVQNAGGADNLPVHLDVRWDEHAKTWTGQFQRGVFGGHVVLKRPVPRGKVSLFAGSWKAGMNRCVHIAQAEDNTFTVWSDQIQVPGLVQYASRFRPPSTTWEYFGQFGTAVLIDAQTLQLNGNPFAAGVAGGQTGPTFVKPGLDGKSLIEAGQSSLAQRTWQRQPSGSCLR